VNYADHAAEAGRGLPSKPSVFLKAPSCVIGPGEPIVRPPTTEQLDYEIELAVVIGREGTAVPRERAMEYVAGYTILNDVSARDLQFAPDGGIIMGKNFEKF
jgi:2-keto-4-pentenoate hydratase/2-oxohepta-3-ene-1,7-dioic acid hydratase in catechol pathway